MGKKSRTKAAAPLPPPCDRCAKCVPATVARLCPKCELVVYCSKECQLAAWFGGHKVQCQPMKHADILERHGHKSLGWAAARNDMPAVRALMEAGADVEEVDENSRKRTTAVFGAAHNGHLAIMVYLVEECGASLRHVDKNGSTVAHRAAGSGHLDVMRYIAKQTPELIDMPSNKWNLTPIMSASMSGQTHMVRHLARLGCSLTRKCIDGYTALDYARICVFIRVDDEGYGTLDGELVGVLEHPFQVTTQNDKSQIKMMNSCEAAECSSALRLGVDGRLPEVFTDVGTFLYTETFHLLSDIDAAGGWRTYARMEYVRIRHEVSKTYAVLDEGHDDRELLHLVFGRNRATVDVAAPSGGGERLEEAFGGLSIEKPKAMLELPDVVFRLVCRMLE